MHPIVPALLVGLTTAAPLVLPEPARHPVPALAQPSPAPPLARDDPRPAPAPDASDAPGTGIALLGRSASRSDGVWPLEPPVSVVHRFDPPESRWGAGHRGVDLAGRPGAVVRSALGGRVTFAGTLAGRGVVTVTHGATRTTYEPVTATVHVGDVVGAGQPLGVLQAVAGHCAPAACLHWGWLRGETYLDPLDLVGRRPVRLWPWDRSGGS